MGQVLVSGKLHCAHESCIHARECPLTSLKSEKLSIYQPTLTVYGAKRIYCYSYNVNGGERC